MRKYGGSGFRWVLPSFSVELAQANYQEVRSHMQREQERIGDDIATVLANKITIDQLHQMNAKQLVEEIIVERINRALFGQDFGYFCTARSGPMSSCPGVVQVTLDREPYAPTPLIEIPQPTTPQAQLVPPLPDGNTR